MTLRVLSLGAGVQSTTLALMAAHGEIEAPECAIFADTQWEPRLAIFATRSVRGNSSRSRGGWADGSMGRRECTNWHKLRPIHAKVRELLGSERPRPRSCEMWLGISSNEAHRMKPSRVKYIENRWPLIECGMSRANCLRWLEQRGVSAPRSACCGCPYLSNEDWRNLRRQPEWAETVAMSRRLAAVGHYMHHSLLPLDEADLGFDDRQGDLFGNECEGMCGV